MKKKHELLKEAYDNYPKGTKFKTFADSGELAISSGLFKISENNHQGFWITDVETSWILFYPKKRKWAEIIPDKTPLLISEDKVPLFEGDSYFMVKEIQGSWGSEGCFYRLSKCHRVIISPETNKAFSTKEAALAWIEAQQPKEIEVKLFACKGDFFAKVSKENITFHHVGLGELPTSNLRPSDIEAISNALKTLSK